MITAVIIDDQKNHATYLQELIETGLPDVRLAGIATDAEEGILLIQKMKPEIVFMDIELNGATGFDLLKKLGTIHFSVIFTSAHERYALQAIRFAALDYLLKPIDPQELQDAVQKALEKNKMLSADKRLDLLMDNIAAPGAIRKLAISGSNGISVIELADILYMKSEGPYTHIYSRNSKLMSSRNLKEYEDLLIPYNFFRIHRSYLVNLTEIKQYLKSDGGHVVVSNGDKVDVSDKKKEELLNKLSANVIFLK